MELAQLIRDRRSVQVYEDRPVPPELVTQLLEDAVWAPNHHMTQPWRFILVHGEGRRRLAEARRQFAEHEAVGTPEQRRQRGDQAYQTTMAVPAFLVVVMEESPRLTVRDEDLIAASMVVQNFLLLAEERGLGVGVKSYAATVHPAFRANLGIQPGERVVVTLQLGYPVRQPNPQPRIPATERLTVLDAVPPSDTAAVAGA